MNTKVVAPIALSVGLLGIVGGVAATQAFQPIAKPKPQVHLVQPAAQTVTVAPSPTTTTVTTPAPVKTTTVVPKVVKPAPVQSTQAVAPAPRTVQKAAVVSTDTSSSTPAPSPAPTQPDTGKIVTNPDGSQKIEMTPGQQPPVLPPHTPSTTPAG